MGFMLSPGVSIQEIDLTTIVPQVSTTAGAFAGFFEWGPVNTRILTDTETTMSRVFQPPTSNTAVFYWSAANFLSYGNNLNIVRANAAGLYNATASGSTPIMIPNEDSYFVENYNGNGGTYGPWFARYPGQKGNSILVSVCPSATSYAANLTSQSGFTASANVGQAWFTTSSSIAANTIVGDMVQVGLPGQTKGFVQVTNIQGLTVNTSAPVVSSNGSGLVINRKWQFADQFSGAPTTSPYAASKSGSNDEMHIIIIDANSAFSGSSTQNYILEKYPFVSKAVDAKNADSSSNYYALTLFNKSKFVYWADHLSGTTDWGTPAQGNAFDCPITPSTITLSGGSDMTVPYNPTQFTAGLSDPNDGGLIEAFGLFQSSDDVDVSLIPTGPSSINVQQYVIDNISNSRKDCITFTSPRFQDVVNNLGNEADSIVNNYLPTLQRSSSYVVVDSAWKYQFDKYANIYRYIPLNSDIAGLCVNADKVSDPWFSPAGLNRGAIKNVAKLSWNPSNITNTSTGSQSPFRDLLYVNGVNPVVTFKGIGTVLYGDKTLQTKPSAFDRIGVRRLFITLEKSIATAAKYSLFEFNDVFTRNAFINMVTPYLRTVKGRRGITDFKVVCDETNNTQDVIDSEQFIGDIYIKPNRAINYITLNFVAVGTGVTFEEIVGTVV